MQKLKDLYRIRVLRHELTEYYGLRAWKRHSLVVMISGLIYVGIGIAYILSPTSYNREIALSIALRWMPIDGWGVVFILAGLLAIISSRWPPFSKTWGYMVLVGLSAGWATVYMVSIIFDKSPWINMIQALSWGLIAFLWWAITGLYNKDDVRLITNGPG